MEHSACENCGCIHPLFKVSYLQGQEGFISEPRLCKSCLDRLEKLKEEGRIYHLRILEKPELNKLDIFKE